ncbi:MAG: hypothetical protein L0H84_20905 [Pseudonocardia sp.]|nr:hypothetical protein [Pseudonocardia sp.]
MTAAIHAPLRLVTCRDACPVGPSRRHHDRLLTVDTDVDAALELMELALTWHELEYPREAMVGPAEWETFAGRHLWAYPERAEQAFLLALDIAAARAPRGRSAGRRTMLDVIAD